MKRKYIILTALSVLIVLLSSPAFGYRKYVRAYRDSRYDMYIKQANIIENQGVVSFWVKCMYSEKGKALVRKELPGRYQKAPIEYGMDYFVYDTNKDRYNIKFASVYANDKEIYRQGSKSWRKPKEGSIASVLISQVDKYLAEEK